MSNSDPAKPKRIGAIIASIGCFMLTMVSSQFLPRIENRLAEFLGDKPLPTLLQIALSAGRSFSTNWFYLALPLLILLIMASVSKSRAITQILFAVALLFLVWAGLHFVGYGLGLFQIRLLESSL